MGLRAFGVDLTEEGGANQKWEQWDREKEEQEEKQKEEFECRYALSRGYIRTLAQDGSEILTPIPRPEGVPLTAWEVEDKRRCEYWAAVKAEELQAAEREESKKAGAAARA